MIAKTTTLTKEDFTSESFASRLRAGLQRNHAPNAQQMSAFAVAIVKSSVPRGE